jgi:hypothetical protein
MNKYVKAFLMRGLCFGGFGPIILAIIYFIISKCDKSITFSGQEILLGTISIYILAFVHAGASVFNQIEEWGLNKSITFHFGTLYLAYAACYFINSWLPFDIKAFLIFTAVFLAVYAAVWLIVYFSIKYHTKKISEKLKN